MGRKIPGKKHRGIKDPFEQLARKNESLKNKINAPPLNPNEQEIPKSVIELNRLRQMVKDGKFLKKKRNKKSRNRMIDTSKFHSQGPRLPGMIQKDKELFNILQKAGESEASFLSRVNSATEDVLKEASIEKKFNLTITRNSKGIIENINCDKKEYHLPSPKKFKRKDKSVNNRVVVDNANDKNKLKLSRKQRLQLKKSIKKKQVAQEKIEFKTDSVRFGEVVHEPPHLRVRPKGAKIASYPKPGMKSLLLNEIINVATN